MKKLFFIGACLLALGSTPAMAQTGGPEVVVVQLYYVGTSHLHIGITRASGQTEDIEVKASFNDVRDHAAAVAYQQAFAKLVREGYTLKSTIAQTGGALATLIFEKRQ
jgi:hypothetical protein